MSRFQAKSIEKTTSNGPQAWAMDCHVGIESVIARFRQELPNWWYSLGECQISSDASCAPTKHSEDMRHIDEDDRFNSGFHADVPQPSTLTDALLIVLHDALAAKARVENRSNDELTYQGVSDAIREARGMTITVRGPRSKT